jgi:hypothetical protein
MNTGAAQLVPSDTVYKKLYQTWCLKSWMEHLAKEWCKITQHTTFQQLEFSCCLVASSVPDDWQGYYYGLHLSGACLYPADDQQRCFQCLRCCANVIISSIANVDFINKWSFRQALPSTAWTVTWLTHPLTKQSHATKLHTWSPGWTCLSPTVL